MDLPFSNKFIDADFNIAIKRMVNNGFLVYVENQSRKLSRFEKWLIVMYSICGIQ